MGDCFKDGVALKTQGESDLSPKRIEIGEAEVRSLFISGTLT